MNQDPNPPKSNSARRVNFRSQEAGGELKMPAPARPIGGNPKPFPGGEPVKLSFKEPGDVPANSDRAPASEDGTAGPVAGGLTLNALTAEQMTQRGKTPAPVLSSFRPFTPSEAGYQEPRRFSSGWVALLSLVFLTLGAVGGYCLPKPADKGLADRASAAGSARDPSSAAATPPKVLPWLTQADNDELDAAYAALSAGKYAEAEKLFAALHDQHPAWESMEIEVGSAQGHQQNWVRARSTLEAAAEAGHLPAEANFHLAMLFAAQKESYESGASFEKAVAIDPSRADIYFRWGESLRGEGKTLGAINKFRSALVRNGDVTVDSLYRLKLWLSEIEVGREEEDGVSTRIDMALAMPRAAMEALFAGAYRDIKAGRMQDAAALLVRAQKSVEPTLFSAIMLDPAFVQENWRPEFAPFFKPDAKPAE